MPFSLCERYEIAFYECDEIKKMFLEVPATSLGKCCFPSSPLLGRSCVPSSFGVVLPFPSPFGCRSFPILLWCGPAFTSLPFELCYRSPHLLGGPAPASKNKQQPWWGEGGSTTTPMSETGDGKQHHSKEGEKRRWKGTTVPPKEKEWRREGRMEMCHHFHDNSIAQFTTTLHA